MTSQRETGQANNISARDPISNNQHMMISNQTGLNDYSNQMMTESVGQAGPYELQPEQLEVMHDNYPSMMTNMEA